jgi:hypothetical protein
MSSLDSAGLIGALVGLIGAGVAIFAIIWGLGFIEYLGGKKKSLNSAVSSHELKTRILSINSPDLPYEIKTTPETDLLVEWKIADAKWFAVFSKERLKKTYRGYLLLDESRKSARYCEELASVRWMAGASNQSQPTLSYQKQFFRGRILYQKSWEVQYGIREDLSPGKIYEYQFDVRKVRNPIKKVIEDGGWEFVPVIIKSHATLKRQQG